MHMPTRRRPITATHSALVGFIIAERRKRNLLQANIAGRLKQSQAWMARIESGNRHICVDEFFALARVIGFDPFKALRKVYAKPART
jgi:transcriptional regulator with XRE-family HTH domain